LLEPSAGRADLIDDYKSNYENVDCIELDLDNASILRGKNYNVIDHDFLNFTTPKHYDAILVNPPFFNGVLHLLHAWDNILKEGQLVGIINAQSIKNPNSVHKKRLVKLLENTDHTCEFITSAFMHEDVQRITNVEIALISMTKKRDIRQDYAFLADLTRDDIPQTQNSQEKPAHLQQEIAIPQSVISRAVTVYNAACRAIRREIDLFTELRSTSNHYSSLLEKSITQHKEQDPTSPSYSYYNDRFDEGLNYNQRIDTLKARAWSTVLKQTKIGKNLSSAVLQDLTSRFEEVKSLAFTEHNIVSFLHGLSCQTSNMQMEMLAEVHNLFLSYNHKNQIYYKGWKSNDKHRVAFKINTTRIILPLRRDSYDYGVTYRNLDVFRDIDKALDLLSGLEESTHTLTKTIEQNAKSAGSDRIDGGHFEVRMYSESIHLFPKSEALINTLNLWVGRWRQWIPPTVSPDDQRFWQQYTKAESFQNALVKSPECKKTTVHRLFNPHKFHESDEKEITNFNKALDDAATSKGLDMTFDQLGAGENPEMTLPKKLVGIT